MKRYKERQMNEFELTAKDTVVIVKNIRISDETCRWIAEWESGIRERLVINVSADVKVKVTGNVVVLEGESGEDGD